MCSVGGCLKDQRLFEPLPVLALLARDLRSS